MRRFVLAALWVLTVPSPPARATATELPDPHSFSRPDQVVVRHLHLDLSVDFDERRLAGEARLRIERLDPAADRLQLDTRDLEIFETLLDGGEVVPFELGPPVAHLGRRLSVPVRAETREVTIRYRTRPEAAALQWLEPAQTAGGRWPFLFTQSQAILARTWVPCQDSPGVRMTYGARIRVPVELLAVMSAANPTARTPDGIYLFDMPQPVPSYLLALAVGDLAFRSLGPRTGVYAEPSRLDRAASELADTERMMTAAEALYGPYRWDRYDLLVLPPAFPFGGMENPRLTFLTPTVLAGDRSLVSLIAHELAHSWSGNLVTNATWNDFWLNEGFTVYFELRIMEAVYGREIAEMLAALSRRELEVYITEVGEKSRDTWLYGDFAGRDPDDGVGPVAYEKGALFLLTLERAIGRDRWDALLRRYFDSFAFRTMTTVGFVEFLRAHLLVSDPRALERVDIDAWIYGPGIPADAVPIRSAAFERVDREIERWRAGTPATELATGGWVTQQWLHFLDRLPRGLEISRLAELDAAFRLSASGNAELFSAWTLAVIGSGYPPILAPLEKFLLEVGRRKFLRPIYVELAKRPETREWARGVYLRARPGYHAVTRETIDAVFPEAR